MAPPHTFCIRQTWRLSLRQTLSTFRTAAFVFLLLTGSSSQCMPGRGGGRRRGSRRMTPLVFKQHIPNVSETTLGASGQTEGKITRENPEAFSELVVNNNPDIIFRDEEGTGDDRIMSPRCRDKLDSLAVSVMHRWHGVRLRVTEGWASDTPPRHHADDSLHYEGRAVDITTSDRDRTKYGMLARLAVDAGFDWVYYDSRSHIHCSVKSESSEALRIGGCFPGNGRVMSRDHGEMKMSDLRVGDHVMTIAHDGTQIYTEVMAFMDRRDRVTSPFLAISTENGDVIHLTETHHIYTHKLITSHESEATRQHYNSTSHETQHDQNVFDFSRSIVVFAKDIVIGDMVYITNSHTGDIHSMSGAVHDVTDTTSDDVTDKNDDVPHKNNDVRHKSAVVHKNNDAMRKNDDILRINHGATGTFNDVKLSRVVGVWRSRGRGIYAPLTDTGTIVVDGVLVSCYALVSDVHIPHNALAPYRVMYQLTRYILPTTLRSMFTGDDTQNGVHWYAKTLYNLGTWVMPKGSLAVQGR